MRPKLLVDMNLSPEWVPMLQRHGWEAVHWSDVGNPRAGDREIMDWAVAHECIVFTHDLDFGTMLALAHEAVRKSPGDAHRRSRPLLLAFGPPEPRRLRTTGHDRLAFAQLGSRNERRPDELGDSTV